MKGLINIIVSVFKSFFSKEEKGTIQKPEAVKKYNSYKIVIDPGHGGRNGRRDPGAVGKFEGEEVYERDIVLTISIELALRLEKLGFSVIVTRVDNNTLSQLKDKIDIVKAENPDLFISIHANSNAGTPAEGIETFYNANRSNSRKLAQCIQNSLIEVFPKHKDRGAKDGSKFYVLRKHNVQSCCLVECEFINNEAQAAFLIEENKAIAEALSEGIVKYIDKP